MWKEIPIFFNNRNRLTALSLMIDYLRKIGSKEIFIIDNMSTYKPLLDYYEKLPMNIVVIKLDQNAGPWAFWQLGLHKKLNTPYIVSDSDLVPCDFCPEDIIERMYETLLANPSAGKVAPGLIIDDLPDAYLKRDLAFKWESQFWHKPFSHGLYYAPVDTTFACYNPGSDFINHDKNIRMGYPYLLKHTPWYVDEKKISDEEKFYRDNSSKTWSHWGHDENDSKLLNKISKSGDKKILHLGCGNEYIPGWINLDISGRKLDIVFDLNNCTENKIPLLDNSIDGFYATHVFELIENTLYLMEELHRIAKNNAKFFLRIPYGATDDAWEDPTHKRAYFENSFLYFSQPAYSKADYGYLGDWQCEKITLIVSENFIATQGDNAYTIIRTQRNIVSEMIVELRAIKPVRPRLLSLLKNGAVELSTDSRIYPDFN